MNDTYECSYVEVLEILKLMSSELTDTVGDEDQDDKNDLPSKIKELLRLLGCYLTKEELNAILRGDVPLDKALSPKAKAAWLIIFDRDEMGKFRPNKEIVNELVWLTEKIAYETIEVQIQRNLEGYRSRTRKELENEGVLTIGDVITDATLSAYGRNTITMTKIQDSDAWFLDFGVKK